ncbi:transcriptional regulator [Limnochorda pilosa]|uniref:Transcriptional regulator n=2 Tax=Limnochorda pilosa TaxID=1555112 RepID=A0A0K2SKL3_LIMPI|nr:transcriptional regulator [Limnochorda pilosa]
MKERLLKERDRLASLWERLNEGGLGRDSLRGATAELSVADQHPADLGTETFERGKDLALRESTGQLLAEVNTALENLERGTYGICQQCGRPIEAERLEALPYAGLCRRCQEEMEQETTAGEARTRPIEEESLPGSFSREFGDEPEEVGVEGEDIWQDVARYGTANTPQDVPGSVSYDEAFIEAEEPRGAVEPVEEIPDLAGNMATDWDEIYPEPRPEAEETRTAEGNPQSGRRRPVGDPDEEEHTANLDEIDLEAADLDDLDDEP